MLRALGTGLLTAIVLAASPAHAVDETGATRIACFIEVDVPAKYSIKKIKIKEAYRQYIKRRNGRIDLMEFPATYKEERTLVEPAHKVMREVHCPEKK
ncbi:MAG: hypothetical protein AAF841_07150 [Pseudomonadota bacterium]